MLQPGDIVDRYEVVGVLGQGGMAIVLEVRHRELGTHHALKVLQIALPGLHERLLQEGRIQAGLSHPNVCHVSDVVRVGGVPGLVMELVAGPSLDTLVANYQPNLPQIDALARGIVSGVRAAHAAGLVHRDVKPANVLIAVRDGWVIPKVADFGLAKAVDESLDARGGATTRSGATMGTPMYMAPEQFRNAKRADHRADLFSLGCMLYELVSGVPPFIGDSPVEVFQCTSNGAFRPLRDVAPAVPERIERAITRALAVDPADRWQSCDEMLDAWRHGVNDSEVQAAWEPAHLALIQSLGPSSRPATSTLSFAPPAGLPDRGPATDRVPVPVNPTAVPISQAMTVFRAAGLVGLGTAMAAAVTAVGGITLAGIVWLQLPDRTPVVREPVPVAVPVVVVEPEPDLEPVPVVVTPPPAPPVATPAPNVPDAPVPVPVVPEPRVDPTLANVRVEGVRRVWLETSGGERYKPGGVPAGQYALQVFFDDPRPTRAMTLDLRAGEVRVIQCQPSLKVCR